jgi:hypothetical protein
VRRLRRARRKHGLAPYKDSSIGRHSFSDFLWLYLSLEMIYLAATLNKRSWPAADCLTLEYLSAEKRRLLNIVTSKQLESRGKIGVANRMSSLLGLIVLVKCNLRKHGRQRRHDFSLTHQNCDFQSYLLLHIAYGIFSSNILEGKGLATSSELIARHISIERQALSQLNSYLYAAVAKKI